MSIYIQKSRTKNTTLRIITAALAATLVLLLAAVCCVGAVSAGYSGNCGDDLTWALDDDGTLVISGTGEMEEFPWLDYCDYISMVVIEAGVTSIGAYAFESCELLESITIPKNVENIGDSPFYWCNSLTSINVDPENQYYKSIDGVLLDSDGKLIQYPAGKTEDSYVIPSDVTSIGNYAFDGCSSLTSVDFSDASQLTSIGYSAFATSGLTSITIPENIENIEDVAFANCGYLTSINVDPENQYYKSIDGVLYSKDGRRLMQYPAGKTEESYVMPSEVTSTSGTYVFFGCRFLTSITISTSLTSIEEYVFTGCDSLTSITIPASVTSISDNAFVWCSNLKSITISGDVPIIDHSAFHNLAENSIIYYTGDSSKLSGKYTNSRTALASKETDGSYIFTFHEDLGTLSLDERNAPAGGVFKGWFTDNSFSLDKKKDSIAYGDLAGEKKEIRLWLQQKYTVTYDRNYADSGDVPMATTEYEPNSVVTVLGNTRDLAKTGYTFSDWNLGSTSGVLMKAGDTFTINENTVLYAHWKANTYTVSFDANGGSPVPTPIQETYDSKYVLPGTDPTRTGYTFDGWWTAKDGGDKITTNTKVKITAEKTLHAHWKANETTVTLSQKDATTLGTESLTATYDSADHVPVQIINPEKTGYSFSGWYSAERSGLNVIDTDGKYVNADGYVVDGKWIKDAAEVTLFANWTVKQYTITFDSKGGSSVSPITQDFGSTVTAPEAPTKTGYTFAGWQPNVPESMPAEDVTCVAQWTANSQPVPSLSSSSRDYGASIWLPATAEPTAAPAVEQPTQAQPTASPQQPTQTPASPAPFLGLLAGLGAAAVFFGLRRR